LEIYVGIDWAEAHHDICVLDESGSVLAKRRIAEGLEGVGQLHALLADHASEPNQVVIGIETDRGLLVGALLAAGYQVYAINPLAASRYRERHVTSGAKSDPGDARVLADLVRTDRPNHRPVAGDSELAASLQVLARAHQNLIWSRQRLVNQLRNNLREYYPAALAAFGTELAHPVALACSTPPRRPPWAARSRAPSWRPFCVGPGGNVGWRKRPPPSRRNCARPSWRRRPCSAKPMERVSRRRFASCAE